MVGLGAGGGITFDPAGTSPGLGGRKPRPGLNLALGASANVSAGAGPVNFFSVGAAAGGIIPSQGPPRPFAQKPQISIGPTVDPLGKWEFRIGGGVGGFASFF